ncbi:hypothetical protein K432DRAFT_278249, partial [Lepidopterella palustris CBS 459.81]
MENNQTAAREARRFLAERVRDDWDWPFPPAPWPDSDEEVPRVTGFRERYYGTTTPDENETSNAETSAGEDPYKFDSPDSIAVAVESKLEEKRRKRKVMLEEEMEWNEGFACFVERRDVWTGATAVKKHDSDNTLPPPPPPTTKTIETLLPLARPLLAHNPIRTSITPKSYPEIYSKVVVSARSPSVPINLSDMTRALVQGWKDSGEWPPKVGPLDPLVGRKKGTSIAGTRGEEARQATKVAHSEEPFLAHHPHVKKGMESVKRIFRLSGGH